MKKVLFILGLIYVLLPGPASIRNFAPLPDSTKSDLSGDTWQNPNNVAYFSNFDRKFITKFYRNNFAKMHLFGFFLPPIRLNHPPEKAYQYIRDQQESSFLEEYLYPLRESIYVNGYEPAVVNRMNKRDEEVGFVGNHSWFKDVPYNSKTTLRYYPSSVFARILVYFSIWICAMALWKLTKKALKEG